MREAEAPPGTVADAVEPEGSDSGFQQERNTVNRVASLELKSRNEANGPVKVYVVPITGQISSPQLFILRRSLKNAIESGVNAIVLELDTPGGSVDTTIKIMEAMDRFKGDTFAFVKDEAISAGAYIASAADYIFMTERGVIGAAEVVMGTGEDVPESMKRKIESYIQAKVRTLSTKTRYRGDVIRAMSDPDFVFEIEGEVIKKEGELLTLTAQEAISAYGDPPENLLAEALYDDVEALLTEVYGENQYELVDFQITWSEELAKYLATISPAILGLGLLLLFIEFKTPGFGIFGIAGICLLLVVFAANYVAGLAGYEEVILFFIGVCLVFLEILVFPGVIFLATAGLFLILVSLVWAMADIWPEGSNFTFTPDVFVLPILNTLSGFAFGIIGIILIARFLPSSWIWGRLVLRTEVGDPASAISVGRESPPTTSRGGRAKNGLPEPGAIGVAATDLFPSGEVDIAGRRYQARASLTQIESGADIEVVEQRDFALIVKEKDLS